MAGSHDQKALTTSQQVVELLGEQKGAVKLQIIRSESESEASLVRFALDYSKADTPDRAYYADYCEVLRARSGYSLFFGKLIPGSSRLRTKVEIAFPENMFILQLWGSTRFLHETFKKIWDKNPLEEVCNVEDTDKVQAFRANNVFMAMLGEESLLDFYYIAPSEIHFVRSGQRSQVHLEPVIRISLPSAMVYEFLEKCRVFIEQIPGIADILEKGLAE
jgi:hypothetical protein